jgi:hypothetical protein
VAAAIQNLEKNGTVEIVKLAPPKPAGGKKK